eukprot:gene11053-13072_t
MEQVLETGDECGVRWALEGIVRQIRASLPVGGGHLRFVDGIQTPGHRRSDRDPISGEAANWWMLNPGDEARIAFEGTGFGLLTHVGPDRLKQLGIVCMAEGDPDAPPEPEDASSHLRITIKACHVTGCLAPQVAGCLAPQVAGCLAPQVAGRLEPLVAGYLAPQVAGCFAPQEAEIVFVYMHLRSDVDTQRRTGTQAWVDGVVPNASDIYHRL